jgi:RNA polymerase sigma-70 factor, ECF subfamily
MGKPTRRESKPAAPQQKPAEKLIPDFYRQLKRLAHGQICKRSPQTLSPTELVHELFLRMQSKGEIPFADRNHFFAVAAQGMKWILTDYARAKGSEKKGGGKIRVELNEKIQEVSDNTVDLLTLNEVFEKLSTLEPRAARVAELRLLAGLKEEEIATNLNVSLATVKRDLNLAKTWLTRELEETSRKKSAA